MSEIIIVEAMALEKIKEKSCERQTRAWRCPWIKVGDRPVVTPIKDHALLADGVWMVEGVFPHCYISPLGELFTYVPLGTAFRFRDYPSLLKDKEALKLWEIHEVEDTFEGRRKRKK